MDFQELLAFAERTPMLSLALVGLTLAIIYTEIARLFRGYKALRPAELTALINRENALVVDLSASGDFDKGHIAGSKSVQPSQFDPENKLLASAKALPVVVVCRNGQGFGRCRQAPEEGRLRAGLLARRRHRRPGSRPTCRWSRAAKPPQTGRSLSAPDPAVVW